MTERIRDRASVTSSGSTSEGAEKNARDTVKIKVIKTHIRTINDEQSNMEYNFI